ncbi:hypothetical protein [[Clostridium] scindens]|uniref:hypothetical protein n=1 Tax=Clostridium scindens (strain JCM 10418 / VPI 12708) TaxID=29347 RepID=UPI002E79FD47|nr:hypothetical protein [[Clostridium] scindens]MEE0649060.1 hypothetical protein [[Clostridium] scindens]
MGEIFNPELIVADPNGREMGFVRENIKFDLDIGSTYDFELRLDLNVWKKEKFWYGNIIYIPGTEYGGILEDLEVITKTNEIVFRGDAWRGMLRKKVVEPPSGKDHLVLNGELNSLLRQLLGDYYEGLFVVDYIDSGIIVENWKVDRYVLLYDAIMKLLEAYNQRLKISYVQGEGLEPGTVHIRAAPITDWSSELEYSQDDRLHFDIRDCRNGINHLVCAGKGQNDERLILHLYVQEDGSIGDSKYYTGLSERTALYEYTSADADSLLEYGTKQLKELQNYKKINLSISNADLELGDIVGGRERVTGVKLNKPIVRKILKISKRRAIINYEIKGDD